VQNSIFLDPPRTNEAFNLISSQNSKKSSKPKTIPSYFVKLAGDILAPYLSHMFSFAFDYGIFPDSLKIAAVTPVFKANERSDVSNYRPYLSCFVYQKY